MLPLRTIASLAALTLCTACKITPDKQTASLDAPIVLNAGATPLRGKTLNDITVSATGTVTDEALRTQKIREVAERAREAVVSLYFKGSYPHRLRILPFIGPGIPLRIPGEGLGSGFFVHESGLILSNNHVVQDTEKIRARMADGKDMDVVVLARDPVLDLALLKVRGASGPFPVLPMGDSEAAGVGEFVLAIGNPLGLGHTVTLGIVSQTNRALVEDIPPGGRTAAYIQTDTAINPGSSGGALVTLTGAWIGVNTAGVPTAQGIGFAVPSRQVKEFLERVLAGDGESGS